MEEKSQVLSFAESIFAVGEDGKPKMSVTIPAAAAFLPASMLRAYIIAAAAQENGYNDLDVRDLAKALDFSRTTPIVWRYQITPNRRGMSKLPCRVVEVGPDWVLHPGKAECLPKAVAFWRREFWQKGKEVDRG